MCGPLFAYELCAVPPALIDSQGCRRKGNKSGLVKRFGVVDSSPRSPNTLIVDVSQLFYHIVWPHGGTPSDLIASIKDKLGHYSKAIKKLLCLTSIKIRLLKTIERIYHANDTVIDYDLTITITKERFHNEKQGQ